MSIISISGHQRKIGWMSVHGRVSQRVFIIFYWVAKGSKFPADSWRFGDTDPYSSVAMSKSNVFFVDLLQIKNKFHRQLLYYHTWSVRLRESVSKRKIQFSFSKLSAASAYERVSAYGNV